MPERVRAWAERGREEVACGFRVFVVDVPPRAPRTEAEAVLVLHGFPSSSLDFRPVMEAFGGRRTLLFDFPGFGLSEKPGGRFYSLHEDADVACALVAARGIRKVHVVAHDMGTSVLAELLARRVDGTLPFEIASVLFFNGSVYVEMTSLTVAQRLLRTPLGGLVARAFSYRAFVAQMGRICGRPIEREELQAMWFCIRRDDGHLRLPETIGYVTERYRYANRWTGAFPKTDLPAKVVWGPLDTVALMPIGERLARTMPRADLVRLEGLGHYPMLEDPVAVTSVLGAWLDEVAS